MKRSESGCSQHLRELRSIYRTVEQFDAAWQAVRQGNSPPRIEDHVEKIPEALRADLFRQLLIVELQCRIERGDSVTLEQYLTRFPDWQQELREVLPEMRAEDAARSQPGTAPLDSQNATREFLGQTFGSTNLPAAPLTAPRVLPDVGDLFGRYKLKKLLGSGGFGAVYLAQDTILSRSIAIKLLRLQGFDNRVAARFLREAQTAAVLRHPNIVRVFESGERDGILYIVYEHVRGSPLSEVKAKALKDPCRAGHWILQLAKALHYAHSEGVVHRDIKPANVLLEPNGNVKLIDFGVAKRMTESESTTIEGAILGTPAFMSPEQATGKNQEVGPKSDQYGLGALFFVLLTGRPPFVGETAADVISQIVSKDPPKPSQIVQEVPKRLEIICLRMISGKQDKRFPDLGAVAEELLLALAILENAPLISNDEEQDHLQSVYQRLIAILTKVPGLRWLTKEKRTVVAFLVGAGTATVLLIAFAWLTSLTWFFSSLAILTFFLLCAASLKVLGNVS